MKKEKTEFVPLLKKRQIRNVGLFHSFLYYLLEFKIENRKAKFITEDKPYFDSVKVGDYFHVTYHKKWWGKVYIESIRFSPALQSNLSRDFLKELGFYEEPLCTGLNKHWILNRNGAKFQLSDCHLNTRNYWYFDAGIHDKSKKYGNDILVNDRQQLVELVENYYKNYGKPVDEKPR